MGFAEFIFASSIRIVISAANWADLWLRSISLAFWTSCVTWWSYVGIKFLTTNWTNRFLLSVQNVLAWEWSCTESGAEPSGTIDSIVLTTTIFTLAHTSIIRYFVTDSKFSNKGCGEVRSRTLSPFHSFRFWTTIHGLFLRSPVWVSKSTAPVSPSRICSLLNRPVTGSRCPIR